MHARFEIQWNNLTEVSSIYVEMKWYTEIQYAHKK